jgi:hypothetical protein
VPEHDSTWPLMRCPHCNRLRQLIADYDDTYMLSCSYCGCFRNRIRVTASFEEVSLNHRTPVRVVDN